MEHKELSEARKLIAGFLKNRREELNISEQQLADLCQVNRSTINRLENGKFLPNMELFLTLTHHLNCHFFLAEKEGEKPDAVWMRERWGKMPEN